MVRIVKEHNVRKNEILDTARKFFYQKGYDKTVIQDILDELGIAKGTFYHYFKSKIALLDALIDKVTDETVAAVKPIIDSEANAIEKFNALFRTVGSTKMENIEVMLIMLRIFYQDENAIIRDKMIKKEIEKIAPLFSIIIKQGVKEGLFNTPYPDDVGEIILQMGKNLHGIVDKSILEAHENPDYLKKNPDYLKVIKRKQELYVNAIERLLGAHEGAIEIYHP